MNASATGRAGAAAPSASGAGAKPSPLLSRMRRRAAAAASASDSGASSSSPSSAAAGNSPPRAKTVRSVSPQHQHHSSSRARSHQVGSPPPLGATSDVNSSFSSSTAAATTTATETSGKPSTSKKSTKKSSTSSITRDWDSSWASADEPWANGEVIYVNDADLEQGGGDVEGLGDDLRALGLDDDDDDVGADGSLQTKGKKKRLPAEMRCFDTARIYVKGGDGGKGCVAFRREKFVPKGGPSGGDGGDGGHVYAVADASLTSLAVFRRQLHFRAPGGDHGGGSKCRGANAGHIEVRVPPGTIFRKRKALNGDPALDGGSRAGGGAGGDEFDDELEPPVAELVSPGERALLAVGGKGGRGNASFKTHKNNAPTMAELGEPGEEWWLDVELRLVADVGIVGVPNAGKSSLLSALSAAKPKVANYPFTTLVPQLGVCELDYRSTVFADVPGLLEGAHAGVGLGHEFLRHVSRCRAAVHVVDGSSRDPVGDYAAVRAELELFSPELAALPQVVAYNKVDLPDSADYLEDVRAHLAEAHGVHPDDVVAVSAATGTGVPELVRRVRALLDELAEEAWAEWEREERARRKRERAEALGAGTAGSNPGVNGGGFRLGDKSAFDDDDGEMDDSMGAGAASSFPTSSSSSSPAFDPLLAAPPPGRDDFFPGKSASGFGSSSSSSSSLARNGRAPGSLPPRRATNALNLQEPVRAKNPLSSAAARGGKIGDYSVTAGRDGGGSRLFTVSGAGIDRFVAMTNWNYYESALRFQKVLEASGIVDELKAQGVEPGDTVSVGGNEFLWSDDRSDGALYEAWMTDRRASGRVMQGSHAWPHAGG